MKLNKQKIFSLFTKISRHFFIGNKSIFHQLIILNITSDYFLKNTGTLVWSAAYFSNLHVLNEYDMILNFACFKFAIFRLFWDERVEEVAPVLSFM